jgi:peptidyl-prolyl cis-trans isomerase SurA
MIRIILFRVLLPVILACTPTFVTAAEEREPVLIDRIIAVVGEDVVMLSELRVESRKIEQRLRQQGVSPMPSATAIQQQAFEKLVMNKLQLAEAARIGIEADEETLSRAIASIAENNQLSVSELRAALEAEGIDFDAFRLSMRDEIVIRRLRSREVTNRIQVTKSEIDNYLERSGGAGGREAVYLLYILIATPDGASPEQREEARVKATQVVEKLQGGADFRRLAQQVSDSSNALEGGDLGWIQIDRVPPALQTYVATMNKGETRGPIAAGLGFHIIQLADVRYGNANIVRQTHARHILIRTNEVTSDQDARRRLQQLRERIVNGDDFDTLARANSDDKASAIKGGDLGWTNPGDMVPDFEATMDRLQAGEVSDPFRTEFGWHIVQVLERREYDATDETRRDRALQAVREEKAEEALEAYLRKLRDEAYIELRLDDMDS